MSINIGLDIGAVSFKLAAIGSPSDEALFHNLGEKSPTFFAASFPAGSPFAGRPFILSPVQAYSGKPHPVHVRSAPGTLRIPAGRERGRDSRDGVRQPASRENPGHLFRERVPSHRQGRANLQLRSAHHLRDRRRVVKIPAPGSGSRGETPGNCGLPDQRRMRRRNGVVHRPAGYAVAL